SSRASPPRPPPRCPLSLHDALPICAGAPGGGPPGTVTSASPGSGTAVGPAVLPTWHGASVGGPLVFGERAAVGPAVAARRVRARSEEHTSELQSRENLVCRLLLEKK